MAQTYTYPHWRINVVDQSIYTPLERETLPLFRPIFFLRTQQGPEGVPTWVPTYEEAKNVFGEGTFDFSTKYFSREALYLRALFSRQGAFMVRMTPDDAQVGSLVLELRVKKVKVPQYERDENGQYILDESNERVPEIEGSSGAQVTEDGVELKWSTRALNLTGDHVESISNLKPTTYGVGENEYTVYPILACKASSAGAFSDDLGIKFFVDLDNMDLTLAENAAAILYSFGAVKKTYGQDTVSPIYSTFDNQYESFVAKLNVTDERTARDVSFDKVISNYYTDKLPWEMKLYIDNIETIGKIIQDIEPEDETLYDPFLVNLCEPYNIDGVPMPHVTMSTDDDAINLTDTTILYMQGGTDGSIADKDIEALTRQYLKDLIYRPLLDQAKFPFTHIIDTGVSLDTKQAFIEFMGKHDAFKVVLATQDANMGRLNTEEEDSSINTTCGF